MPLHPRPTQAVLTASGPTTTVARHRGPSRRHLVARLLAVLSLVGTGALYASLNSPEPASAAAKYRTLWDSSKPPRLVSGGSGKSVELGTRFVAARDGRVHGVRFYKNPANKGRHVASLWGPKGKRLARAVFTGESGSGWQRVKFGTAPRIRAGAAYTVSYHAPRGRFAVTHDYRGGDQSDVLSLTKRRGGVFRNGSSTAFPTSSTGSQYWVDPLFAPIATAADSPSAPPAAGTCAADPSSCGYPDADNTGPASTSNLVRVPADKTSGTGWRWNATYDSIFVSGKGAVLDGLDVAGSVVIDAPDVTLKNSRIASCGGGDDTDVVAIRYRESDPSYRGANARIVDNVIKGTPSGCDHRARSGVRDVYGEAPNVFVQGNDISGTGNGITIEYDGVVAANWIHDLGHIAGDHHSGISTHGGARSVVFRHNTVLLHGQRFAGGGGVSGALTIYSDFGHAQNVTLNDNLISGGSYVIYGGNSGDGYTRPATDIRIVENRYVCGDWLYGPLAAFDGRSSGNEFTGNYCDGSLAPVRP